MVAQGGRVSEGVHGQAHAGVGLKVSDSVSPPRAAPSLARRAGRRQTCRTGSRLQAHLQPRDVSGTGTRGAKFSSRTMFALQPVHTLHDLQYGCCKLSLVSIHTQPHASLCVAS